MKLTRPTDGFAVATGDFLSGAQDGGNECHIFRKEGALSDGRRRECSPSGGRSQEDCAKALMEVSERYEVEEEFKGKDRALDEMQLSSPSTPREEEGVEGDGGGDQHRGNPVHFGVERKWYVAKSMERLAGEGRGRSTAVTASLLRTEFTQPVADQKGELLGPQLETPRELKRYIHAEQPVKLEDSQRPDRTVTLHPYLDHLCEGGKAGELTLSGTEFLRDYVSLPAAVSEVDLRGIAWPSPEGAKVTDPPYQEERIRVRVLPKEGEADPGPPQHGAAQWQHVLCGAKRVIVSSPPRKKKGKVSLTLLPGMTLYVPPGWEVSEIGSEHSVALIGSFYLAACLGEHARLWRRQVEWGAGCDACQKQRFLRLAWLSGAYLCATGKRSGKPDGSTLSITSFSGPDGPLSRRERSEAPSLASHLQDWLKEAPVEVIPDPSSLLADLRSRAEPNRGNRNRPSRASEGAAIEEPRLRSEIKQLREQYFNSADDKEKKRLAAKIRRRRDKVEEAPHRSLESQGKASSVPSRQMRKRREHSPETTGHGNSSEANTVEPCALARIALKGKRRRRSYHHGSLPLIHSSLLPS